MPIDYKKTEKEFYMPKTTPSIIDVPTMTFIMVDGTGNPNTAEAYKTAVEILYGLSYSIKMSKKSSFAPDGYFDYVVPPLEGFWWLKDDQSPDFSDKDKYCWTSMIRQPDFVTSDVFAEAKASLSKKKPELDISIARLERFTEGLCAHVMHIGTYDEEPKTIEGLEHFITESGYQNDISETRRHHEIYLNDPRKVVPEKNKTVIRHPIRKP